MNTKIIINAVDTEECRIAKVQNNQLDEFHIETTAREITRSNIYKGVVTRIEPSLEAVFIDYGADRNGFLQKTEIHYDYFNDNDSGDMSIQNVMKKGQELLVQVIKDPVMKKGAMLTTFISLPGRFVVLMPGRETVGISRKITSEAERKRLKELILKLDIPEGFGLIVRTAGELATKSLLQKDLRYLMRLWKTILKTGMQESSPELRHNE